MKICWVEAEQKPAAVLKPHGVFSRRDTASMYSLSCGADLSRTFSMDGTCFLSL